MGSVKGSVTGNRLLQLAPSPRVLAERLRPSRVVPVASKRILITGPPPGSDAQARCGWPHSARSWCWWPGAGTNSSGHIINVTTWSVTAGSMPKYSAYYASKSALDAFGRSLRAELGNSGIAVTSVQYPLVRTPMSDATSDYRGKAALTPDDAADWLVTAVRTHPRALYPRYAGMLRLIGTVAPGWVDRYLLTIS